MMMYYEVQPALEVEAWFPISIAHAADESCPPNLNSLAAQAYAFAKSSAVVRMFSAQNQAGFRFQVTHYFSHKTSLAKHNFLFEHADSMIETKRLEQMLISWCSPDTSPLVTVIVNITGKVTLEQKPFARKLSQRKETLAGGSTDPHSATPLPFPMMYFELENPKRLRTVWFEEAGHPVLLQSVMKPFKLNWHHHGFYRVNYTKEMWTNFARHISGEKNLDPEDKASLLDDAFTLAEYGHIHHGVPLSLLVYLRAGHEMHPLPWLTAAKHLMNMYRRTMNTEITYLLEFLVKLLVQEYLDDDSAWVVAKQPILDVIRRVTIIDLAGTFYYGEVINRLQYALRVFLEEETINMELKKPTFAHALKGEDLDEELFEAVLRLYKEEVNAMKKWMYWTALVGVRSEALIENLWELAKEPDEPDVDPRCNRLTRIKVLSTNPLSHSFVWPFIGETWPFYSSLPLADKENIRSTLLTLLEYSRDLEMLQDIGDYGEGNQDPDVQHYAQKAKADCDRWNSHNYMLFVEEWLHLYIMNST